MDTAHDHEVDRLMNLPLELRQRVYLFCGFPVAKDWYHACRDEVMTFISLELGDQAFEAVCTAHFIERDGATAKCSSASCWPAAMLMCANKRYNSELEALVNKKGGLKLKLHTHYHGFDNNSYKWYLSWDHKKWFTERQLPRHINAMVDSCFVEARSQSPIITIFPLRNVTKVVLVMHWHSHRLRYVHRAPQYSTGNLAGAVSKVCLHFPHLKALDVVIDNIQAGRPRPEVYADQQMLSTLLTLSICLAKSLRSFKLRFESQSTRHPTASFHLPIMQQYQGLTFNVKAMPLLNKADTLMRLFTCMFGMLMRETIAIWNREGKYPSFPIGDFRKEDFAYLTWHEGVYLDPTNDDKAFTTLANAPKAMNYKVTKKHLVLRKVVGWQDNSLPIWDKWSWWKEFIRECRTGRKNAGVERYDDSDDEHSTQEEAAGEVDGHSQAIIEDSDYKAQI